MRNEKLLELACSYFLCDQEDDMTLVEAYDKLVTLSDLEPNITGHQVEDVVIWETVEHLYVDEVLSQIDSLYDDFLDIHTNPEKYN